MLKVRVIPTLLWKQFGLVKGVGFASWRRVGPVLPAVKVYNQREVDELVLVDIVAHRSDDDPDFEAIDEFGQDCFVPLTVGGGVRKVDDIRLLLNAGADKVSINSAAVFNPEFVQEASQRFGAQCIVVAIDAKKTGENKWEIFTHGGRKPTGIDAIEWAVKMAEYGAGELLITSMDADGTKAGYDLALMRQINDRVTIPTIASGGVGTLQHLADGILKGGADAVLAASIFHFGQHTIPEAKQYLAAQGIEMRL